MENKETSTRNRALREIGSSYADNHRRRKMNLIILLCMPLVPMIIVTIYAVVTNRKDHKHTEPTTV